MEYIIVTKEWCRAHGIALPAAARTSVDGSKVILHKDFVAPVIGAAERVPSFPHYSEELSEILLSPEWSAKEDEYE